MQLENLEYYHKQRILHLRQKCFLLLVLWLALLLYIDLIVQRPLVVFRSRSLISTLIVISAIVIMIRPSIIILAWALIMILTLVLIVILIATIVISTLIIVVLFHRSDFSGEISQTFLDCTNLFFQVVLLDFLQLLPFLLVLLFVCQPFCELLV